MHFVLRGTVKLLKTKSATVCSAPLSVVHPLENREASSVLMHILTFRCVLLKI